MIVFLLWKKFQYLNFFAIPFQQVNEFLYILMLLLVFHSENHAYSYQFIKRILETKAKRLKKEPVLNRFARSGAEYAELVESKTKEKANT